MFWRFGCTVVALLLDLAVLEDIEYRLLHELLEDLLPSKLKIYLKDSTTPQSGK
jgi:hypothetical protein